MNKTILFLAIYLVSSAIQAQQIGLPFSKFYSSKEYNGGIQNYAIGQDPNGLLYVANNFGLLEYDGTSWARYSLPNSTKIRDILVENNGRIYIAAQGQLDISVQMSLATLNSYHG